MLSVLDRKVIVAKARGDPQKNILRPYGRAADLGANLFVFLASWTFCVVENRFLEPARGGEWGRGARGTPPSVQKQYFLKRCERNEKTRKTCKREKMRRNSAKKQKKRKTKERMNKWKNVPTGVLFHGVMAAVQGHGPPKVRLLWGHFVRVPSALSPALPQTSNKFGFGEVVTPSPHPFREVPFFFPFFFFLFFFFILFFFLWEGGEIEFGRGRW